MSDRSALIEAVLTRLSQGGYLKSADAAYVLVGLRGPRRKLSLQLVDALLARGLLRHEAGRVVIAKLGEEWLAQGSRFVEQHQVLETRCIKDDNGRDRFVVINAAESPLTLLARLKWLGPQEVEAGEKLRRDYTIGQLSQRMGIDYSQPIGARSHRPDMADTALAARQRFHRALKAMGPGHADLLFDICCSLKGLEESERARGWPRGSAKVVLRLALMQLASHYGFGPPQSAKTRSWAMSPENADQEVP